MQIDGLLDIVVEPQFKERPFEGAGMRIQAPLEPNWLEATWHIFVGVRCPLEPQDTVDLLTKRGLDMKIGSSDRVDAIFRQGGAGLKFAHVARPPRELPMPPGQVYLQIANNPQDAEWQHVQKALTMAIRLNENFVAGNIHGQRTFHIKHAGKTVPTQFTLYLVPTAKKS
jgi:type VI secretion system protein ImpJ